MQNFVFALPTRIVFGAGSIDAVGGEVAPLGSHALVVTGTTFARRSGLIDRLRSSLDQAGVSMTVFDQASPQIGVRAIDQGGEMARQSGADVVIGLGGGSALDAAKAIAASARLEGSIWSYVERAGAGERRPIEDALPLVQLPIVASTGTETSDVAIVYSEQEGVRAPIRSPRLQARAAIVDPSLTFSVPPRFTAVGAMNIVSQMLESYLTSDAFSVSDRVTEGLLRVVMDSLPRAMRRGEDLDARSNLSWVAVMAPTISSAGRSTARPLQAMAHPLTAHYGIEHGIALAALWPSYMRYALSNRLRLPHIGRYKRYALLGRQLFGVHETDDEVAAETTTYRFTDWLRGLEMPTSLRQLEVSSEDFPALALQAVAVSGTGARLPSGLTAEDVENIYFGALRPV